MKCFSIRGPVSSPSSSPIIEFTAINLHILTNSGGTQSRKVGSGNGNGRYRVVLGMSEDYCSINMRIKEDNSRGKKMVEETYLEYFLEAYNQIIDEPLSARDFKSSETPDFICQRPDGSSFGVELTEITRSPKEKIDDWLFEKKEFLGGYEATESIIGIIQEKEEKRRKNDWKFADNLMLVLLLTDSPLESLLLEDNKESFLDHGFREIWLADCTHLEEFQEVDLFCVFLNNIGVFIRP